MGKNSELPPRCPPVIEIGDYEVDTWYSSPYPEEYATLDKLYLCEFCLSYMTTSDTLGRHNYKCHLHCPPANEIYRSKHDIHDLGTTELSIFEADGAKSKLYCQNLCLLAKLFLDTKTLYYDVEHFLFYILTKNDKVGSRIIGYFSKEKHCQRKNNVSCIMILPQYQKYGYGRFLIEFSYLLSTKENTLGSPEKPLSDLGLISYMNFWNYRIIKYIVVSGRTDISVKQLSEATNMSEQDVLSAINYWKMLRPKKGDKDDALIISQKDIDKMNRPRLSVNPKDLRWTPYVSPFQPRSFLQETETETETEIDDDLAEL